MGVHFSAELLSCWRPSICKWFVLQWMDGAGIFWRCLTALPRLMGHHYSLPHVLRYLLSSQQCWPVWNYSGSVGYFSFNSCWTNPFLRMSHFIGLLEWLIKHPNVFHLSLLPAWLCQCSWGFTYFCTYTNSMFHVVFGLVHTFGKHKSDISYIERDFIVKDNSTY